jgi:hypothetical protein
VNDLDLIPPVLQLAAVLFAGYCTGTYLGERGIWHGVKAFALCVLVVIVALILVTACVIGWVLFR